MRGILSGKMRNIKIIAAFVAILLAISLLGMDIAAVQETVQAADTPEEDKGIAVGTITPEVGSIAVIGEYIGTIEPIQQVTIQPKIAGEVLAVYYDVGDHVKVGDVLFEIDATTLEQQIAQTEAQLTSAQATADQNLKAARKSLSLFDQVYEENMRALETQRFNAEIAVQSAENQLRLQQVNLKSAEREAKAWDKTDMTPGNGNQVGRTLNRTVKQTQIAVEQAELGVEQSRAALELAMGNSTELGLQQQRAGLENAVQMAILGSNMDSQLLALDNMRSNLENYKGIAPFSGIVEMRNIEPFNMAAPGAPAFIISDTSGMAVTFKVSRDSHAYLSTGSRVEVEDISGTHDAYISEISTMVDPSGLFTVKATIPRPPADLFTGSAVKVYADVQRADETLILPISALHYERGVPYVFLAEKGIAKKVAVEVGLYDSEIAQIIEGIEPTDQVISTWSHNLTDGAEIVVVN